MSDRPFMQLYVSDFIGDTLHLSTEQIGAYMLLLMAMWNSGGTLPDDDAKLARVTRLSLKKWRAICDDLLCFFDRSEGVISHNRLTKEIQKSASKSQSRASAGARGGAAKALKSQEAGLAIAVAKPKHLPDTIYKDTSLRSVSPARAKRLPADWVLPNDWRQDAVDVGLDPSRCDIEAEKMRDWSRSAKAGAKLDWRAAWRNWCRKAHETQNQPRGSPKPRRESFAEVGERLIRGLENDRNATAYPDHLRLVGPLPGTGRG